MEIQSWIIGQIVIEVLIIVLVLWFIKSHLKLRKNNDDLSAVFKNPEKILAEMQELAHQLDRNLEEKKALGRKILNQLDEVLERADQSYNQLQSVIKEYSTHTSTVHPHDTQRDSNRVRTSVKDLLKKGLSKEEIARHLGISVGEIELLIKLQKRQDKNRFDNQ